MRSVVVCGLLLLFVYGCVAPPVTEQKKPKHDKGSAENNEIEDQAFDVEYKRYLQEVVNVLENDEDFKNRLTKADPDDIKTGKIAKDIEFVNHNVRTKLDELKRQELERLRHMAMQQYEHDNGIDRKHMKIPAHLDPNNPHTFEAEDLRKLIVQTTKDLEDADRMRKSEFKEYEMRKELEYQEQLKRLDEKHREDAQKQHDQQMQKHKEHKPLHHPGSKPQLEEVWEEQDHLSPEDFNPKTFFHLHDLDGNGYWDANEVKALFKKELDKMYDPNAPEDDMKERMEEMERMREHVFNETDTNKDHLISFQEFLSQTKKQEFERDEGWEPLDQHPQYSQDEYQQYAKSHEEEIRRMIEQGLIPPAPPGYVPVIIPPGAQHHGPGPMQGHHPQMQGHHPQQQGHHLPPPGVHPNAIPHGQGYGHPNDPQGHFQDQRGLHQQQGGQGQHQQVPYQQHQGSLDHHQQQQMVHQQQHYQQQLDHHQQQQQQAYHPQQQQFDHHQQQQQQHQPPIDHHQQQQIDHHQQQQIDHHQQQQQQQQHQAIPAQYNHPSPPVASHAAPSAPQVQQHQQDQQQQQQYQPPPPQPHQGGPPPPVPSAGNAGQAQPPAPSQQQHYQQGTH